MATDVRTDCGGPAFPSGNYQKGHTEDGPVFEAIYRGMTIRDWFAGQALPKVMEFCRDEKRNPGETFEQLFARRSFDIADAMLEARKQ